jgi:S-adenosylmethionine hydrolase
MARTVVAGRATDFGTGSPYVAQMKGVILSLQPRATLVDVTHAIPPQDVDYGAFVLGEVCFRFPRDTIHIAVVDPGVGTDREMIYAKIGGHHFLAPDNGLLSVVAARHPVEQIVALTEPAYWLPDVSKTFHGRDILSPVAARLSEELDPLLLGLPRSSLITRVTPQPVVGERTVRGEVIAVDPFGNLITNIEAARFPESTQSLSTLVVRCGEREVAAVVRTYGERPAGTLVALVGSSGRWEVAVVNGSAAAAMKGGKGTHVSLNW